MDYKHLTHNEVLKSIEHWNEYRVPILRISNPDNDLNFFGAMRFYFQDSGQKVATKCVKVTSADTTKDVIDVLIEKFRPDMRMLSVPEYGLYEIHENGDERKLALDERPIFVQLDWNKDDREGRFLLRRMDEKTRDMASQNEEPSLKRKLSKKEKKKQEKLKKLQQKEEEKAASKQATNNNKNGIAERLYNELPETSFTRSISNPEAVMKRRRAQKLERRLQEFSQDGGQQAGGTLRIFGEAIIKGASYKTLLLSTKDTASSVVKQVLEKYGKDNEDPSNYCLVQLIVPPSATSGGDNNSVHDLNTSASLGESILDDQDCPLLINQNHDKSKGILTFHIRQKPADYQKRRKKKPSQAHVQQNPLHPLVVQQLNQRLQMNNINNNSEQYRNQNSPQNSSQTSGSLNQDLNNPPPPSFETVQSMPTMFPARNGPGVMYYPQHQNQQQQQHHQPQQQSLSTSTLPRMNNNNNNSNSINMYPQQYAPAPVANDQILPALIQVKEDVEDIFLSRVITYISPNDTPFRLAPTYVLYMVSRYRASTLFHPELQAPGRAELFMPFTRKIATMIRNAIESHMRDPTYLAFWLANSSDLSHFYKQDKHLSHFTIEAQEILYDSIKASFKYLLSCKQLELDAVLHTFFDEQDDNNNLNGGGGGGGHNNRANIPGAAINHILDVLNDTMATLRKNRVNAALTIQIFSHLFHHISKWLFDRLIGVFDNQPGLLGNQANFSIYCNRAWGEKLGLRLAAIGGWAEKQGLEQAADFHLTRVTQVTMFLARRYPQRVTPNDLRAACDSCSRLNPVQLRALLQRYQPDQPIVGAIIENILYTMDYSYMAGDYPLEEDFELKIPFLIPEDGYSSELIRYIPTTLLEFVNFLSKIRVRDQELCIFTVQPTSSGHWTVYFKNHQPDTPEVIMIQLRKMETPMGPSMGLSIIAAKGVGQERLGIYIKSVVKDGAAAMDGRLQAGDQLLEVDGNSLLDITQDQAATLMMRTGPVVTLKIAKQAAIYHHVSDIINIAPSQTMAPPQSIIQQHQQHQQYQHQPPPPPLQQQQPPQHQRSQQHIPPPPPPQAFLPPIPAPLEPIKPIQQHVLPPPPPITMQSPIKSPKKVSWVDTQPHQSLHTLIPLPHEPEPVDIPPPEHNDDKLLSYSQEASNGHRLDELNHQHRHRPLIDEEDDDDDDDDDDDETSSDDQDAPLINGQAGQNGHQDAPATNGQVDTTGESLTLEDIDEVLSSKTHNWPEDSAGVIGTQEVYNDPRHRIVAERERTNADINIEKLSFQEKLKMFKNLKK